MHRLTAAASTVARVVRHPAFLLIACAVVFATMAVITWSSTAGEFSFNRLWSVVAGHGAIACVIALWRHAIAVAAAGSLIVVAAAMRGLSLILAIVDDDVAAGSPSWALAGLGTAWMVASMWLLRLWGGSVIRWAVERWT